MIPPPASLRALFPRLPRLVAADIGASDLDGTPPYARWLDDPQFALVGFEPSPEEFAKLAAQPRPGRMYFPHALGDGGPAELKICRAPGMTSLREPKWEVLRHFHGFPEWATVERRLPVQTHRLDDIPGLEPIDYLKIDVQGAELDVLGHGLETLRAVLCVQIEVNFVPFYEGQPLFGEIDTFLRGQGFLFHRFTPLVSRTFTPFLVNHDIFGGLSQVLWSDAVYFRDFTAFSALTPDRLGKLALIAHDLYGAVDLAHLALAAADRQTGDSRAGEYLRFLGMSR